MSNATMCVFRSITIFNKQTETYYSVIIIYNNLNKICNYASNILVLAFSDARHCVLCRPTIMPESMSKTEGFTVQHSFTFISGFYLWKLAMFFMTQFLVFYLPNQASGWEICLAGPNIYLSRTIGQALMLSPEWFTKFNNQKHCLRSTVPDIISWLHKIYVSRTNIWKPFLKLFYPAIT